MTTNTGKNLNVNATKLKFFGIESLLLSYAEFEMAKNQKEINSKLCVMLLSHI
jgi:hypothetical protein